jgi:hypothetical protein
MAENKNRVQAGHLLKEEPGFQMYELSIEDGYGVGGFDMVTAAFNSSAVAVRVSRGAEYADGPLQEPSQVVLTRADFEKLIASYRAFERAEKKRAAAIAASGDDFDPFLD